MRIACIGYDAVGLTGHLHKSSFCRVVGLPGGSVVGLPGGSVVKNLPANTGDQEMWVQFLGREDPLEKEMTTCSSILA